VVRYGVLGNASSGRWAERQPTDDETELIRNVGLMLAGIALLGVITASFASWFLERIAELTAAEARGEVTLEHVLAELQELRAEVRGVDAHPEVGSTASGVEPHVPSWRPRMRLPRPVLGPHDGAWWPASVQAVQDRLVLSRLPHLTAAMQFRQDPTIMRPEALPES
jgi:hypothetical protein